MRILVFSDTHGSRTQMQQAVLDQPAAEVIIHLGDGEREAELLSRKFPEKAFLRVRGNCDFGSSLRDWGEYAVGDEKLGQVKIFYTHGHLYGVKGGLYRVKEEARDRGARILLYGHTHEAYEDYEDGLYILNPGSASGYLASYGTVDITPQGIVTNIIKLQ